MLRALEPLQSARTGRRFYVKRRTVGTGPRDGGVATGTAAAPPTVEALAHRLVGPQLRPLRAHGAARPARAHRRLADRRAAYTGSPSRVGPGPTSQRNAHGEQRQPGPRRAVRDARATVLRTSPHAPTTPLLDPHWLRREAPPLPLRPRVRATPGDRRGQAPHLA